jgi:hypothetical protein
MFHLLLELIMLEFDQYLAIYAFKFFSSYLNL